MCDEHRQQLVEQYEEAAISLLMDEYAEAEGARLLREYEEAAQNGELPEIPAELDAKCRQLIDQSFRKQKQKHNVRNMSRIVARAAVFVFVFLGVITATVLSVDALRIPVMNFFLRQTERYTSISLDDRTEDIEMHGDLDSKIAAAPIPDGYSLVSQSTEDNGTVFLCYQNEADDAIVLTISPSSGLWNIDTEDATQEKMMINNCEAVFFENDGYRIIWIDEEESMTYDLVASNLEKRLFLEFAYYFAD